MKYGITYKINCHPEGVEVACVPDEGGACDRIVAISIIDCEDGGTSYMALTVDRNQEPLPPLEIFKAWLALGEQCGMALPDGWCRNLCLAVSETIREKADELDIAGDEVWVGPMFGTTEKGEA